MKDYQGWRAWRSSKIFCWFRRQCWPATPRVLTDLSSWVVVDSSVPSQTAHRTEINLFLLTSWGGWRPKKNLKEGCKPRKLSKEKEETWEQAHLRTETWPLKEDRNLQRHVQYNKWGEQKGIRALLKRAKENYVSSDSNNPQNYPSQIKWFLLFVICLCSGHTWIAVVVNALHV